MDRLTCTHCQTTIPNGTAVLRSISFVQVAFHPACYFAATGHRVEPVLVSA